MNNNIELIDKFERRCKTKKFVFVLNLINLSLVAVSEAERLTNYEAFNRKEGNQSYIKIDCAMRRKLPTNIFTQGKQ